MISPPLLSLPQPDSLLLPQAIQILGIFTPSTAACLAHPQSLPVMFPNHFWWFKIINCPDWGKNVIFMCFSIIFCCFFSRFSSNISASMRESIFLLEKQYLSEISIINGITTIAKRLSHILKITKFTLRKF